MKLSTAFMLGTTTCKLEPKDINSCAFGCALNAMGVAKVLDGKKDVFAIERYIRLVELWPWLSTFHCCGLGAMREAVPSRAGAAIYVKSDDKVCAGKMTLEQLHDYITSVEPECGECNRFDRRCEKTEN